MSWAEILATTKEVFTTLGAAVGFATGAWRVRDEWRSRNKKQAERLLAEASKRSDRKNGRAELLDLALSYKAENAHEGVYFIVTAKAPTDLRLSDWNTAMEPDGTGNFRVVKNIAEVAQMSVRADARKDIGVHRGYVFAFAPSSPNAIQVQVDVYSRARSKRLMSKGLWIAAPN